MITHPKATTFVCMQDLPTSGDSEEPRQQRKLACRLQPRYVHCRDQSSLIKTKSPVSMGNASPPPKKKSTTGVLTCLKIQEKEDRGQRHSPLRYIGRTHISHHQILAIKVYPKPMGHESNGGFLRLW